MAASTETTMPIYVIYRETRPGEPFDPSKPPVFFPPKDSDELFDALRAKYPHVKSHAERMRDAVIEFLIEERQTEQSQTSPVIPSAPAVSATSPWQSSWPSVSTTTLSSPETASIMTPMFGNSPPAPSGPSNMDRQISTGTGADSVEASPPALAQMTSVFSLSSTEQPKQRIRRKMTEAEKVEYRKRRIVKACDKCSKRKRKCHHNQPDMECIASNPQRITKPSSTTKKAAHDITNPAMKPEPLLQLRPDLDMSNEWTGEIQTFDDFTALLEDPQMGVYDLFHPETFATSQEWQWPATEDFTLLDDVDSTIDYNMFPYGSDLTQSFDRQSPGSDMIWEHLRTGQSEESLHSGGSTPSFGSRSSDNSMVWQSPRPMRTENGTPNGTPLGHAEPIRENPQPQHTLHTHTYDAIDAFVHHSICSEPIHSESPVMMGLPTPRKFHGVLGPDALGRRGLSEGLQSNDGPPREGPSTPIERLSPTARSRAGLQSTATLSTQATASMSISQVTLRLTGTAKALRNFGRVLDAESPSRSELISTTVGKVARAATIPTHLQNRIPGRLRTLQYGTDAETHSNNLRSEERFTRWKNLRDIYNSLPTASNDANLNKRASQAELLGLEIDSLDKASLRPDEKKGTAPGSLAMNPAPGNSKGMLQSGGTSTAQQGRQGLSLGGTSLDDVQPPMPQLPLLRRPLQQSIRSGEGAALAQSAQSLVPSRLLKSTLAQKLSNAVASAEPGVRAYNVGVKPTGLIATPIEANVPVHTRPTGPSTMGHGGTLTPTLQLQRGAGITDELYRRKTSTIQARPIQTISGFMQVLFTIFGLVLLGAMVWTVSDLRRGVSPSVLLLALLCPILSSSGETGKSSSSSSSFASPAQKARSLRSTTACALLAFVC